MLQRREVLSLTYSESKCPIWGFVLCTTPVEGFSPGRSRLEVAHSWASHGRLSKAVLGNYIGARGVVFAFLADFNNRGDLVFSDKCHRHVLYPA